MVFEFLKKKDSVCGMTQKKEKGISSNDNWFCSENCKSEFEKKPDSVKELPSCC